MVSREHQQLADALGVDPDDMDFDEMVAYVAGLEAQRVRLNDRINRLRANGDGGRNSIRRLRNALMVAGVSPELIDAIERDGAP